ncbi:serpin family protein [Kitasatospora sp. NPDC086801]|uniref:serpin family protein n=1 Tax=Kitasatospora sp. NPDC086801 TaxID=3364066 RepID=UPI0038261548
MTKRSTVGHHRSRRRVGLLLAAGLAAGPALAGCGSTAADGPVVVRATGSASRAAVDPGQVAAVAAGTSAFGLDLLHALTATPDGAGRNVVVSPAGLASVLGMLLPGARGTTAEELAKALHTGLDPREYALAVGAPGHGAQAGGQVVLRRSDDLWTQQGLTVAPEYLDTLAAAFDAGVHPVDFAKDPAGARRSINAAVEKATEGRIKELFGPQQITADTRLALTDALYLKAAWASGFKPANTSERPFRRLDGSTPSVSTMSRTGTLRYAEGSGGIVGEPWQAVELPYAGGGLAMDLIVPAQGGYAAFSKGLDQAQLDRILGGLGERSVDLTLPRFHFDTANDLVPALRSLGVKAAFDAPDFTGITAKEPLGLGAVVQKAAVEVNEDGTVAAAGSGAGVAAMAAPAAPESVQLHIDRPFLFLIRDTVDGRPLFLGQVTDPQAP